MRQHGKQGESGYPQAGYLRLISLRTSSSNPQGTGGTRRIGLAGMRTANGVPVFLGVAQTAAPFFVQRALFSLPDAWA